jgi:hypothetical protein
VKIRYGIAVRRNALAAGCLVPGLLALECFICSQDTTRGSHHQLPSRPGNRYLCRMHRIMPPLTARGATPRLVLEACRGAGRVPWLTTRPRPLSIGCASSHRSNTVANDFIIHICVNILCCSVPQHPPRAAALHPLCKIPPPLPLHSSSLRAISLLSFPM